MPRLTPFLFFLPRLFWTTRYLPRTQSYSSGFESDSRATGAIIGFVLGIMGKAKSHFSRSPIPASFSSTLNVRFHGPLGDVIARSRVFRFSNTLETTRNEADNFWCSLFTYFFLLCFGQVDTSKGNRYHVWESEKNLKSCCRVNSLKSNEPVWYRSVYNADYRLLFFNMQMRTWQQ